jgi:perosamine synthetase
MIPYGKQTIDDDDIRAVIEALKSDWLTTGPTVNKFEEVFSEFVGAKYSVSFSSGTSALHAAAYAAGISQNDEVIVPSITFVATANCVVYQGGTPVFADVDKETLLISPSSVKERLTSRTKAIISVDYTGQPCNYDELRQIASDNGLILIADACHSLGARWKSQSVGTLADLNAFSFHPVKHITTGEGGMITTNNRELADKLRLFRNHGISADSRKRELNGTWFYEMEDLGYNYRLTDIQCALGISQIKKVGKWIERRREIASIYGTAFSCSQIIRPLSVNNNAFHSYHLYVVRVKKRSNGLDRQSLFTELRNNNIGANVHYIPVHLHPFYKRRFGTAEGLCPNAEQAYEEIITLPIFAAMTDDMVEYVIKTIKNIETKLGG